MSTWIDFKQLRQELNFVTVLQHYHIEVKTKGDRATGLCPLPTHPRRTDGQKRTASFSANLAKGIWQCFGCKASGNCAELCLRMEGFDPSNPAEFRKGALKVAEVFGIVTPSPATTPAAPSSRVLTNGKALSTPPISKVNRAAATPLSDVTNGPPVTLPATNVVVNEPLNFELKHLDPRHPYLLSRGISPEAIAHFGLGFCTKGLMADRIAIPLHDLAGSLVGYAGRLIDDAKESDEQPKYRFPGTRDRNGTRYEFHKNRLLYNAHRISGPVHDLAIVEGFVSVWWLWQANVHNVVALMGSSCSRDQARAVIDLVLPKGRIWLFPDGDDAGKICAASLFEQLAPSRFVRWVKLNEGTQPTDFDAISLSDLLRGVEPIDPTRM